MKTIEVSAAIIRSVDKVFATQRGYGPFKDGWEFPGGKLEKGETGEEAVVREIKEELAADILVESFLCTVEHDYPDFHLTMHCYICKLSGGELTLLEHEAAKWVGRDELDEVGWLPADRAVIEALKKAL